MEHVKQQYIRKDLMLIGYIMLLIAVVLAVLKYVDIQQGVTDQWAHQVYSRIIRK